MNSDSVYGFFNFFLVTRCVTYVIYEYIWLEWTVVHSLVVLISEVSWDGIWWFLRTIWIQLIILSCYLVFLVSDHVSFLELIDFCLMFIKKITIEVWRLFQQIKAKKPSWKIGSSFSIKKPLKVLPKVQIDDDLDLIDEDSLLSEEDLKKPQLPPGIVFFEPYTT